MRKKKKRKRLRPPRTIGVSKKAQPLCIKDWLQPDWLKEAKCFIRQDEPEKAAQLLSEQQLDRHIRSASKLEKQFIRFTAAGLLRQIKQFERTENLYKEILESNPGNIAVYNELARLYENTGRLNEAVRCLVTAMKIDPDQPEIWSNLGADLMRLGKVEEAISFLRKTVEKMPDNNLAHSALLLAMNYMIGIDPSAIFEESKKWAMNNAPLHLAKRGHDNDTDPDRRLRIGYISPDFREHSVTFFFEPLLDAHNRQVAELYGYGNVTVPDETTVRLKKKFCCYRDIKGLDDKAVAKLIENDKIDILVDLGGHFGNSGIYSMIYKPAPIQVTWMGYPNTTGLSQIDYRLTDCIADPPGSQEFYTEKLFNLPNGFLCYRPGDIIPAVARPPVFERGHITFGSFNNSIKINPLIIELWSRVLKAVPDSKLLLKFKSGQDDEIRQMYLERFAQFGIANSRIDFSGFLSPSAHLELYNSVDIALDTYPYNGTTTTCQALLMGVPVISLVGDHHMSRVGRSILTRLGLEFFAASTPDEYVSKASVLAAKPEALAKMRATMRSRMVASDLCNRDLFAKNIEQAYRKMWHDYCASKGVEIKPVESHNDIDHKLRKLTNPITVEQIILADKFYQAGKRAEAVKYAAKAFSKLSTANNEQKPPQQLLQRYNADDLQSLIINFCIETMAFSSYFSQKNYFNFYAKAKKVSPSDPDIDLRIGLLTALQARLKNVKIQDEYIKLLETTNNKRNSERSKAVLALAKGELKELSLPYDLGRIHLYPDLENITTYVLLEQGDWFEKSDLNFFRSIIRPDDIIFDLGANVGTYSLSAAARTNGKVIAVEPAIETFELLNKSASQFPSMTAVHAAVSDKPGTAFLSHDNSSENFKLSEGSETQGEDVPLVTVDDIAAEHGIESVDIIKMDVEGHELKALAGAEKIITNGSPIIFYEVKHGADLHPELIDALENLGYDSYFALPDAKTIVKYDEDIPIDEYLLNMIAIRPESLQRLVFVNRR